MRFEIVLSSGAVKELAALRADARSGVREAIEPHPRHEPTRLSKSRIKRLRGIDRPQYRLRVGEIRVFYDVTQEAVEVLAILEKQQVEAWLAQEATPAPPSGPREGEG